MGNAFVLSLKLRIFYGIIGGIVVFVNVYLVCLFIVAWDVGDDVSMFALKWFILSAFLWIYLGFIGYLFYDFIAQKVWKRNQDKFEAYSNMKMHINQNELDAEMTSEDEQDSKPLLAGQPDK